MKLEEFNEELKHSVKFNIPNLCEKIDVHDFIVKQNYKKTNHFKTFAFSAMSIVLVFVFSFYLYMRVTPVTMLTIDFNPSLEIELNAFDRVVNINAVNDDAELFIEGLKLKNKSVDAAMNLIYEQGIVDGYFTSDNAFLLIGVIGRDYESEEEINDVISLNSNITTLTVLEHVEHIISITSASVNQSGALEGNTITTTMPAYITSTVPDYTNDASITGMEDRMFGSEEPNIEQLLIDLDISQTKLAVAIEIFNATGSTYYSDLEYLASLDIETLITMYNNLH